MIPLITWRYCLGHASLHSGLYSNKVTCSFRNIILLNSISKQIHGSSKTVWIFFNAVCISIHTQQKLGLHVCDWKRYDALQNYKKNSKACNGV